MADRSLGHTILDLVPNDQTSLAEAVEHNVNRLISFETSRGRTKALRLAFGAPPRDVKIGFLVGNTSTCDLVFCIPPGNVPWRFAITFNTQSGIPVVENGSAAGIFVGDRRLTRIGERRVIEKTTLIRFGQYSFTAHVPDRGRYQEHYRGQLGRYLGYIQTAGTAIITKTYSKPLVVRKRIDQYLEIESLGSGGFGEVSLLVGEWTGHVFAAKKFKDPRNVNAIYQEVATLQNLRHVSVCCTLPFDELTADAKAKIWETLQNNIVGFVGCVRDDVGSICLVMEYLSYGHLSDFHVPEYCAIEILKQCLDGLNYIHHNQIIHRDIKPNNVVLRSVIPIHACIIDFGLATLGPQIPSPAGTPIFIPPEVWAGHPPMPTVDIWSLGLTGLHLFGKFPQRASERFGMNYQSREQLRSYVRAIFAEIDTLAPVVRDFFNGMLAQHPVDRWSAAVCLEKIKPVQQFLMTRSSTGERDRRRSGACSTITARQSRQNRSRRPY